MRHDSLNIVFARLCELNLSKWRDIISSHIERLKVEICTNTVALERARNNPAKTGKVKMVPAHDSMARIDCTLVLNGSYLYIIHEEKVKDTIFLHFDAIVAESTVSSDALEIVTMTGKRPLLLFFSDDILMVF